MWVCQEKKGVLALWEDGKLKEVVLYVLSYIFLMYMENTCEWAFLQKWVVSWIVGFLLTGLFWKKGIFAWWSAWIIFLRCSLLAFFFQRCLLLNLFSWNVHFRPISSWDAYFNTHIFFLRHSLFASFIFYFPLTPHGKNISTDWTLKQAIPPHSHSIPRNNKQP